MNSCEKIKVYIEIEQFSNKKYEFNKRAKKLELDRILPYPYFYPFSYGFIPNTLGKDGDELDALIITNHPLKNNQYYMAYIVGVLIMEDEQGMDEKILCVLEEDWNTKNDVTLIDTITKDKLEWFFSNYKSSTPNKWSKVYGFQNREFAVELYNKSIV